MQIPCWQAFESVDKVVLEDFICLLILKVAAAADLQPASDLQQSALAKKKKKLFVIILQIHHRILKTQRLQQLSAAMSRFLTTSKMEAEKEHKIQFLQRNLSTERLFYWVRAANCLYQEPSQLQPCAKDRQPDSRALVIFLQLAVSFSLCVTGEIIYKRYCPFDGNRVLQPRAVEKAPTHHIRFRLTIN